MAYCSRCWLFHVMRSLNLAVNLLGMGMIIYSLWLLKVCNEELSQVGNAQSHFPRPWFIYACLGVGIIVCFSSLLGHVVFTKINITAFSIYIVSLSLTLLFQLGLIMLAFFKTDWENVFSKYLDDENSKFIAYLSLHFGLCRLIGVIILLAQGNVLILAIVLWTMGPESREHCHGPAMQEFRHTFLIGRPDSSSDSPQSFPH